MDSAFEHAVTEVRAGAAPEEAAQGLVDALSPEERLSLLDGDVDFWPGLLEMLTDGYNLRAIVAGAVPRLGIPGLRFTDGPRGVVMGASTAFPVSPARGATWDVDLEERVGRAMGAEARAQGANVLGSVCVNLPRHPAWGRSQESYGGDPLLLGEMAAGAVGGLQDHVIACVKHFALNSIENTRHDVDVQVDEADLHEVYLPHFRRAVEAGAGAVMTAYNAVNGSWCGESSELITDILRDMWGFRGVTISDFVMGFRDATRSLAAGLDVEMPYRQQRAQHLPAALASGEASWLDVDAAAARILAAQLRHAARVATPAPSLDVVASAEHRALAREVAVRGMVVLRNEVMGGSPLLPLQAAALGSLAVLGRLANLPNTGDHGSSDVRAPSVVTPLAGLTAALPWVAIRHDAGEDLAVAAEVAAAADVAIVVVGYTAEDEGEYFNEHGLGDDVMRRYLPPLPPGLDAQTVRAAVADTVRRGAAGGDRASLTLHREDEELVLAVTAANPRTVVVVVAGGAVVMESWRQLPAAIVLAWYAGMEGGHALADVLLGHPDAGSGRLPFAIPCGAEHLPPFPPAPTSIEYGRLHGQRLLDHLGIPAAYPLGFGLSYTRFRCEDVHVDRLDDERCLVRVLVRNVGERPGRHVVQVYGRATTGDRAGERSLLGFASVWVADGQAVMAEVDVSLRPLARWDPQRRTLVIPSIAVCLEVADHAGAEPIFSGTIPELGLS